MWKMLRLGIILTALAFVPKWVGASRFWIQVFAWMWARIGWLTTDAGRVALLVVGISLIWLDQYRRTRPKAHDLETLKGRTLQLRDDLQEFTNALGPKPKVVRTSNMDERSLMAATWKEVAPWVDRLTYGYERRFAARVREVYLEFGERSLLPGIGLDLPDGLSTAEDINRVIEGLEKLAAKTTD